MFINWRADQTWMLLQLQICEKLRLCFHASYYTRYYSPMLHDDVIKWKYFLRYWPYVWGIHRSSVNSPHKGQCHGTLMFYLICAWINGWVKNRRAVVLRRHRAHYDVSVMWPNLLTRRNTDLNSQTDGYVRKDILHSIGDLMILGATILQWQK